MGVAEKLKRICKNSCFLLNLLNKYDFQARNYKEKVHPLRKKKVSTNSNINFSSFVCFIVIRSFSGFQKFPSQSSLPIIFEHYKLVCR